MSDAVLTPVLKAYAVPNLPVPPAVALPVLFITAMEAGRKFALGTARALRKRVG